MLIIEVANAELSVFFSFPFSNKCAMHKCIDKMFYPTLVNNPPWLYSCHFLVMTPIYDLVWSKAMIFFAKYLMTRLIARLVEASYPNAIRVSRCVLCLVNVIRGHKWIHHRASLFAWEKWLKIEEALTAFGHNSLVEANLRFQTMHHSPLGIYKSLRYW